MKRFALFLTTLLLAACAASGPQFRGLKPTVSTNAAVYLFRPHHFPDRNVFPYVFVDGTKRDPLRDSGYVVYQLSPGEHSIEVIGDYWTWNSVSLKLSPTL